LAWLAGAGAWAAGLLPVLSFNILADWHPLSGLALLEGKTAFELYDLLIATMLLPLNALLLAVFTGWVIGARRIADVLGLQNGLFYTVWNICLRYVLPVSILILWLNSWG
jgi:NSS family neurotransmitter:Na+ symporter